MTFEPPRTVESKTIKRIFVTHTVSVRLISSQSGSRDSKCNFSSFPSYVSIKDAPYYMIDSANVMRIDLDKCV